MTINIRTKGQIGEREIAKMLNSVVTDVRKERGLPLYEVRDELFQRNQLQSAVGGDDLTNPLGLSIEVKRQETLSIPVWWKQTLESASRADGIPILIYRQNRKKWQVMMYGAIFLQRTGDQRYTCPVGLGIEDFKSWFRLYYIQQLNWRDGTAGSDSQYEPECSISLSKAG